MTEGIYCFISIDVGKKTSDERQRIITWRGEVQYISPYRNDFRTVRPSGTEDVRSVINIYRNYYQTSDKSLADK